MRTNGAPLFLSTYILWSLHFTFIPQVLPHLAGQNKLQNAPIKVVLGRYSRFFTANRGSQEGTEGNYSIQGGYKNSQLRVYTASEKYCLSRDTQLQQEFKFSYYVNRKFLSITEPVLTSLTIFTFTVPLKYRLYLTTG